MPPPPLEAARAALTQAAHDLFHREPQAHSIGIGPIDDHGHLGFIAEYRTTPWARPLHHRALPDHLDGWPIVWRRTLDRARPLAHWPRARRPLAGIRHPEQAPTRPLVCGLEIQNIDADHRAGVLPHGCFVGTLGCWVRTAQGEVAMLSNAHVLADSGQGRPGHDRILQAGCRAYQAAHHVAHLGPFMPLHACPPGTLWGEPGVVPNQADAAIAPLIDGVPHAQSFLGHRDMHGPRGTAPPTLGEPVFKIGRTTGLTRGVVDRVNVIYSVPYDHGDCWFEDLFSVVSREGPDFADGGDSGAVVVRLDGTVLGLVFAGAPMGTLCCEIDGLLKALDCSLL